MRCIAALFFLTLLNSNAYSNEECRFYLTGITKSGKAIPATHYDGMAVSSVDYPCASCHRRSGYGGSEGGEYVPPITADHLANSSLNDRTWMFNDLFKRQHTHKQWTDLRTSRFRPAYSDYSLFGAITLGVDSAGRRMSSIMPRYQLTSEAYRELKDCLAGLVPESIGVSEDTLHLATVIHADGSTDENRAMLDVMRAFERWTNAEYERWHAQSVQRSPYYRAEFIDTYRRWKIHVWQVEGEPETWANQLDSHMDQQAVFAMVGGLLPGAWQPVHDFCAQANIPCLFPNTLQPGADKNGWLSRSIYFHGGLNDELALMHQHASERKLSSQRLWVVPQDVDTPDWLPKEGVVRYSGSKHLEELLSKQSQKSNDQVVFYLPSQRFSDAEHIRILSQILALGNTVYLPSTMAPMLNPYSKGVGSTSIYITYPYALASDYEPDSFRARGWLQTRRVKITHPRLQMNTYFAMKITQDGIRHILDQFSRQYFIEKIEHEVESALNVGVYPNLSLGPDQRFASRGGYIVQPVWKEGKLHLEAVTEWRYPQSVNSADRK